MLGDPILVEDLDLEVEVEVVPVEEEVIEAVPVTEEEVLKVTREEFEAGPQVVTELILIEDE